MTIRLVASVFALVVPAVGSMAVVPPADDLVVQIGVAVLWALVGFTVRDIWS